MLQGIRGVKAHNMSEWTKHITLLNCSWPRKRCVISLNSLALTITLASFSFCHALVAKRFGMYGDKLYLPASYR